MWHHALMKRSAAVLALVVVGCVTAHSHALADCMCAANGTRFEQGETTCIRLSSGNYLARCEKVLNNSSWTRISNGCQDVSGLERPANREGASIEIPLRQTQGRTSG